MAFGIAGSTTHIDVPLSNLVIGFEYDQFIVDRIFPVVTTPKKSDKYYIYTKEDFARVVDDLMGDDMKAKGIEWSVSNDTFFSQGRGLHGKIYDVDAANADAVLDLRNTTSTNLMSTMMRNWENRVAGTLQNTAEIGSWTTLSGASLWSAVNSGNPVGDLLTGIETIEETTGLPPNTLIMPLKVLRRLGENTRFIEGVKYTNKIVGGGISTIKSVLTEVTGIQNILVPNTKKNTGVEGGTASFSGVWDDNVHLLRVGAPNANRRDPSFGYTFRWGAAPKTAQGGIGVERWRMARESGLGEIVQVNMFQDEKVTSRELGYTIFNTLG